jgi:Fe2+ or Zn2+ uptake regulation protein
MKKTTLNNAVAACKEETRIALQTVYDALNQGQQKKIVKDEGVKALFDRYGVEYEA